MLRCSIRWHSEVLRDVPPRVSGSTGHDSNSIVDSDGTCEVLDLGRIFVHCTSIAWSDECEFGLGYDSIIGT